MKKNIIIFLFSLLTVIVSFSQTTYPTILNDSLIVITPVQLKQTNLIFLEHHKLKEENFEYKQQLNNYDLLIKNYEEYVSIQNNKIDTLIILNTNYNNIIQDQNQKINVLSKKKKVYTGIAIGGVTLSVSLLLILLLAK